MTNLVTKTAKTEHLLLHLHYLHNEYHALHFTNFHCSVNFLRQSSAEKQMAMI